jgi:hypothetical protein
LRTIKLIFAFSLCLVVATFDAAEIKAQQFPAPDFKPPIENPAYAEGKGPVVLIDEAYTRAQTNPSPTTRNTGPFGEGAG